MSTDRRHACRRAIPLTRDEGFRNTFLCCLRSLFREGKPSRGGSGLADSLRPWPFETILISMLLEQEEELDGLRSTIKEYGGEENEEVTAEIKKG